MTDASFERARIYEEALVPVLFAAWPPRVLDAADVSVGHRVLDVGCGSGVLARAAADRAGADGRVVGVDPSPGMLQVARQTDDRVEWISGTAEDLPFADASFDRVVSEFALMFFTDRRLGLREMGRVLRPGGRVAVATWAALDLSPAYRALTDLIEAELGAEAAKEMRSPYVLGDRAAVHDLLADAFDDVSVEIHDGTARFDSIDAWVGAEIRSWTFYGWISRGEYEGFLATARRELASLTGTDGSVELAAPAVIGSATRRS